MRCENCGYEIPDGSKTCQFCGHKISSNTNPINSTRNSKTIITFEPTFTKIKSLTTTITAVVILSVVFYLLYTNLGNSHYEAMVRNGHFNSKPDATIETLFNNFFANPKWSHFPSTTNQQVVQFEGECMYNNKRVPIVLQFIVNDSDNSFNVDSCKLDNRYLNIFEINSLIDTIIDNYK